MRVLNWLERHVRCRKQRLTKTNISKLRCNLQSINTTPTLIPGIKMHCLLDVPSEKIPLAILSIFHFIPSINSFSGYRLQSLTKSHSISRKMSCNSIKI